MINIKQLSKSFGSKKVFVDADATVETGSICGLIGINGAGKSTLLRILSGVMTAEQGEVTIDGQHVYENESVKERIFFLSDDPYYDLGVTGQKLKTLYEVFYNFDNELFNKYAQKFTIDLKKPIRNFSKGMRRQLFISVALACRPDYLFLDEAFDGLDPLARLEFKRGIIDLQERGSTVIIASHSLRELEDICDSFILIDDTSVKVSGKIENALNKIFKLQLAFSQSIHPEQLPFEYISAEESGRVITVVARGDVGAAKEKLSPLNPIIMEEIPMDLEDMFIEEVRERGYLK